MPHELTEGQKQRIVLFFEHWLDFETPGGAGIPGADGEPMGAPGMPAMFYRPPVREFYRCVDLYRHYAPRWYWHLAAYYKSEWRTVRIKTGEVYDKEIRAMRAMYRLERERVLPQRVNEQRVGTGVRFVQKVWDPNIDPSLPTQLLKEAA